jgi:hypothetical protein
LEAEFVKCWIVENARGETGRALQA